MSQVVVALANGQTITLIDESKEVAIALQRTLSAFATDFRIAISTANAPATASGGDAATATGVSAPKPAVVIPVVAGASVPKVGPKPKKTNQPPLRTQLRIRVPVLLDELQKRPNVSPAVYGETTLNCANTLFELGHYDTAQLCYERFLAIPHTQTVPAALIGSAARVPTTTATAPIAGATTTALTTAAAPAAAAKPAAGLTTSVATTLEQRVHATYGQAVCMFRMAASRDRLVKQASNLAKCMTALRLVQTGMQSLIGNEPLCWLLFNGSIHLYDLSCALITYGYGSSVVEFLNWTILCLESTVPLCAPRYLLWRVRVYIATAKTYERMNDIRTSLRVVERAIMKVAEVTAWEQADPPIPAATQAILNDSNAALKAFLFKYKFLLGTWTDAQAIENLGGLTLSAGPAISCCVETLSDPQRRILHSLLHSEQKNAGTDPAAPASAASRPTTAGGVSMADEPKCQALLRFAIDKALPFLKSFTAPQSPPLPAVTASAESIAVRDTKSMDITSSPSAPSTAASRPVSRSAAKAAAAAAAAADAAAAAIAAAAEPVVLPLSKESDAACMVPLSTHASLLKLAFSHGMYSDYLTLHNALVPRIDQCDKDVSGRDIIIDEASILNIIYRLEKLERVNSLDTLEKLSSLLDASVDRAVCTERPDFLLDAALYMWDAHCKPLLKQIKIIEERHFDPDNSMSESGGGAGGASSAEEAAAYLLLTPEEKRRHADARSGLASFTSSLITCLNSLYKLLVRLEFDDQMILAQIVLELVTLLDTRGSAAPGSDQSDWKHAVRVLNRGITTLERHRSDLVRKKARDEVGGVIHSIRADFDLHISKSVARHHSHLHHFQSASTLPRLPAAVAAAGDEKSRVPTAAAPPGTAGGTIRPLCGTLPRVENTLACLHADLLMHLYRIELKLGAVSAQRNASDSHAHKQASAIVQSTLTSRYQKAIDPLVLPVTSSKRERTLMERCGANRYERAILYLQMARLRSTVATRKKLLQEAIKMLDEAETEENTLLALCNVRVESTTSGATSGGTDSGGAPLRTRQVYVYDPSAAADLNASDLKPGSQATTTGGGGGGAGAGKPRAAAGVVLPAPVLVDKTAHTLTVRPVVPHWYVHKYKLRAVIVFGKAADAGVAVSTHNNELKGVGVEIPVPRAWAAQSSTAASASAQADSSGEAWPPVFVHDLLPNTAYVFATIGVDQSGQYVPNMNGIGLTSHEFITCLPLPLPVLWAYFAVQARQLGGEILKDDADGSSALSSDEKSSLPPSLSATATGAAFLAASSIGAIGSGAGAGIRSLPSNPLFYYPSLIRQASSVIVNRFLQTKPREPQSWLVPYHWKSRLEFTLLNSYALERAPLPVLYLLVKVLHIQADSAERDNIKLVRLQSNNKIVRPPAYHQLAIFGVVRPLLMALQVSAALDDQRLVMATVERVYNVLLPVLPYGGGSGTNHTSPGSTGSTGAGAGAGAGAGVMLLQSLVCCYEALTLVRDKLRVDEWPQAINRIAARICFQIVSFYDFSAENGVAAHILKQHVAAATTASDYVRSVYEKARAGYEARKRERDDAIKLLEEKVALLSGAPKPGDDRKKRAGTTAAAAADKKTAPASKEETKTASGAAGAKSDDTKSAAGGRSKLSAPAPSDSPRKETEAETATRVALESAQAALAAANAVPAEVPPLPSDFYVALAEENALTDYLLANPLTHAIGERLAKVELGRRDASKVLLAQQMAAQNAAAAAAEAAAIAAGKEAKDKRKEKKAAAAASGAATAGGAAGASAAPSTSSGDTKEKTAAQKARRNTKEAEKTPASDAPAPDIDVIMYGLLHSNVSCELAYQMLNDECRLHPRYLECVAKICKIAIARGEIDNVEMWVAAGEDLFVSDARITGDQSPTTGFLSVHHMHQQRKRAQQQAKEQQRIKEQQLQAIINSNAYASRGGLANATSSAHAPGFGFSSARRAAQLSGSQPPSSHGRSPSNSALPPIVDSAVGAGSVKPSAQMIGSIDELGREVAVVAPVAVSPEVAMERAVAQLEASHNERFQSLSPLDLLWFAELESLRASVYGARIRQHAHTHPSANVSTTASLAMRGPFASPSPILGHAIAAVSHPSPLGWEWNLTRYADLVPAAVYASTLKAKDSTGAGRGLGTVLEDALVPAAGTKSKSPLRSKANRSDEKKSEAAAIAKADTAATSTSVAPAAGIDATDPAAAAAAGAEAKKPASTSSKRKKNDKDALAAAAALARAAEAANFDRTRAEHEQWRRLAKSAYFAAKAQAWIQLQNAARNMWNTVQSYRITPAELAVRSYVSPNTILSSFAGAGSAAMTAAIANSFPPAPAAASAPAINTAIAAAPTTGTALPAVSSPRAGAESAKGSATSPAKRERGADRAAAAAAAAAALAAASPDPVVVTATAATAASAGMSPVASFASAAFSLCDCLEAIRDSGALVWPSTYDRLHPFQLQQWQLFTDAVPLQSPDGETKSADSYWFLRVPELHMNWLARFVVFAIEALFHIRSWTKVIELSTRFQTLTEHAYGECVLKYMVYAQQEICAQRMDSMEAKSAELVRLEANMRTEEAAIINKKNQRRSQRGKREEDMKIDDLKRQYTESRLPIEKELETLTTEFEAEDDRLTKLTAEFTASAKAKSKGNRALEIARYKLLRMYCPLPEVPTAGNNVSGFASAGNNGSESTRSFRGGEYYRRNRKRSMSTALSGADLLLDGASDGGGGAATDGATGRSQLKSRGGASTGRSEASGDGLGGSKIGAFARSDSKQSLMSHSSKQSHDLTTTTATGTTGGKTQTQIRSTDRATQVSAVIGFYQRAIKQLRESGSASVVPLARACIELGDLYATENQLSDAAVAWSDAVDVAFGTLHALSKRAELLPAATGGAASTKLLESVGVWNCLSAALATAKLAKYVHYNNMKQRMECVHFSSALFTAFFTCSLSHPFEKVDFADYDAHDLWPGFGSDFVGFDPFRVRAGHLTDACEFVATNLILYGNKPIDALPVLTLYQYIARYVNVSVFGVVNSRLLKARALIDAGLMSSAANLLVQLLDGRGLPTLPSDEPAVPVLATAHVVAAVTGSDGAAAAAAAAPASSDAPQYAYHNHLSPDAELNRSFIEQFLLVDHRTTPRAAHIRACYGEYLWVELTLLKAHFLTRLGACQDMYAFGDRAGLQRASDEEVTATAAPAAVGSSKREPSRERKSAAASAAASADDTKRAATVSGVDGKEKRKRNPNAVPTTATANKMLLDASVLEAAAAGADGTAPTLDITRLCLLAAEVLLEGVIAALPLSPADVNGVSSSAVRPAASTKDGKNKRAGSRAAMNKPSSPSPTLGSAASPVLGATDANRPKSPNSAGANAGADGKTGAAGAAVPILYFARERLPYAYVAQCVSYCYYQLSIVSQHTGLLFQAAARCRAALATLTAYNPANPPSNASGAAAVPPISLDKALVPVASSSGGDATANPNAAVPPSSGDAGAGVEEWRYAVDVRFWLACKVRLISLLLASQRRAEAEAELLAVRNDARRFEDEPSEVRIAVRTAHLYLMDGAAQQLCTALSRLYLEPSAYEVGHANWLIDFGAFLGKAARTIQTPLTGTEVLSKAEAVLLNSCRQSGWNTEYSDDALQKVLPTTTPSAAVVAAAAATAAAAAAAAELAAKTPTTSTRMLARPNATGMPSASPQVATSARPSSRGAGAPAVAVAAPIVAAGPVVLPSALSFSHYHHNRYFSFMPNLTSTALSLATQLSGDSHHPQWALALTKARAAQRYLSRCVAPSPVVSAAIDYLIGTCQFQVALQQMQPNGDGAAAVNAPSDPVSERDSIRRSLLRSANTHIAYGHNYHAIRRALLMLVKLQMSPLSAAADAVAAAAAPPTSGGAASNVAPTPASGKDFKLNANAPLTTPAGAVAPNSVYPKDRESLLLAAYYLMSSARVAEMARYLQKNVNQLCDHEIDHSDALPPAAVEEIAQSQKLHRRLRADELAKNGATGLTSKPPAAPALSGKDEKGAAGDKKLSKSPRPAGGAGAAGTRRGKRGGEEDGASGSAGSEDGLTLRAVLFYYLSLRNEQFGRWFERLNGSSAQDVIHPTANLVIQLHAWLKAYVPLYQEKCCAVPIPVRPARAIAALSNLLLETGTTGVVCVQWRHTTPVVVAATDLSKAKRVERVELSYFIHRTAPAAVPVAGAEAADEAPEAKRRGNRAGGAAGGNNLLRATSKAVGAPTTPTGAAAAIAAATAALASPGSVAPPALAGADGVPPTPNGGGAPDLKRVTSTASGGSATTPSGAGAGGVSPKKGGRRGGGAAAKTDAGTEPDINYTTLNAVSADTFAVGTQTLAKATVLAVCGTAAALKTRIAAYAGKDRDITPADRQSFTQLLTAIRQTVNPTPLTATVTGTAVATAAAAGYEPACTLAVVSLLERVFDNSHSGGVLAVSLPVAAFLSALFPIVTATSQQQQQ